LEQTVELFSGKDRPFSLIARALGYETFTFDSDAGSGANLIGDVRTAQPEALPHGPLVVWSAPPCEAFLKAQDWSEGLPKTDEARMAEEVLGAAITLMSRLQPKWWFIETPKLTLLRKLPLMTGFNRGYPSRTRKTVAHRNYGAERSQESDIWTNAFWWKPEPAAPASPTAQGTSKPQGAMERVPAPVYSEILSQLELYEQRPNAG
jgi:hypothetical protein